MQLTDIMDTDLLAEHLAAGYVRAQNHPTEPLTIYCYTAAAQHHRVWDQVTRNCRGLIVHADSTIVARPPGKFFNLGEHDEDSYAGPLQLLPPITVYDKVDGSAAIGYLRPSDGQLQFATKGSFTSAQAEWANAHLATVLAATELPPYMTSPHLTVFAEIIYPENRIVVDYGDLATMVLLSVIDIASGQQTIADLAGLPWPLGHTADSFGAIHEPHHVNHLGSRPNTEGYVLLSADRVTRVKVKEAEYVRLHALLTQCTTRTIWEYLRTDTNLDRLYDHVPDEFSDWLNLVVGDLRGQFDELATASTDEYKRIFDLVAAAHPGVDESRIAEDRELRKEFAEHATAWQHPGLLFQLLDGLEDRWRLSIWAEIRPAAGRPFTNDPDLIEAA